MLLALQLVVVIAKAVDSVEATLCCFEREGFAGPWRQVGSEWPCTLGLNGLSFEKREGDRKSPCGVFPIEFAFGDEVHKEYAVHMPYVVVEDGLECVDDPKSAYYNQFVYAPLIQERDWDSSEKMAEMGKAYELGLVVGYNRYPVKSGEGSAIFIHIGTGGGTFGCTAMGEKELMQLVSWLDAQKRPCLVQFPLREYQKREVIWGFPICKSFTKYKVLL